MRTTRSSFIGASFPEVAAIGPRRADLQSSELRKYQGDEQTCAGPTVLDVTCGMQRCVVSLYRRPGGHRLWPLSLLIAACGHETPVQPEPYPPAPPFSALLPRRLTFNVADDRTPSWLPDGSGIIYSTERTDRPDHDRCLAILPAEGGTVGTTYCQLNPEYDDSTDVLESPAVSSDGRIFFLQVISWVGRQKLGAATLRLGQADNPVAAATLREVPYAAPNGRAHSSIRTPQWISRDSLVYLAEQLYFSSSAPVFAVIPGTDYASSVSVSADGAAVYYTLGGDSRVFRRVLSTGELSVVYDFGAGTVVRDAQVREDRLVAVVGGSVLFRFEDAHGYVQRDEGGHLAFVDLTTGASTVYATDSVLFRHPAISPDGRRLVVEAQPYAPVHAEPDSEFNATNHRADLWLFALD
jgi:Tol biopolymer transport system component